MRRNLESRVETLVSVEDPDLREELRDFVKLQLKDRRSAWEMDADGSYTQRTPTKPSQVSSQAAMIAWAEKCLKQANRLRKRKPRGPKRNLK